jgi:hypothetical protein
MHEVIIAKNIQLQSRLKAKEIWVSAFGDITIVADHFGPKQSIPYLCVEYLEAICSKFYFNNYTHQNAIADILLLNGALTRSDYEDFYDRLRDSTETERYTVIWAELPQ